MAREIHDTLAQGFTSVLMLVQAAEATLDTDPETTRERLSLAAQTARENLAEARSLVGDVGPADLAQMPLDTVLRRVVERTGRELRIGADVLVSGDSRPLSPNTQVVLLRVVQEALANVRKHAQAGSVAVRLAYRPADVRLEITDDGVGFDPAECPGFGLSSMRSRVEQVEGTVRLLSAPGSGTTVEVEVPWTS
jgi:signal transduction histidine kinase